MTVATLITVAALPALWLMQRDSSSPGSGSVAVAGPSGGIAISGGGDEATTSTTIVTTTTEAGQAIALVTPADATATAAVEAQPVPTTIPADRRATGTATYKRYTGFGIADPCMAPRAPVNVEITVRSQNSGRTVTCRNVVGYTALPDPQLVIVINTETFLQIADTSDAPVFVEITW